MVHLGQCRVQIERDIQRGELRQQACGRGRGRNGRRKRGDDCGYSCLLLLLLLLLLDQDLLLLLLLLLRRGGTSAGRHGGRDHMRTRITLTRMVAGAELERRR